MLHWAFLPILLGAWLTACLEQRGYVHLYPSEPVDSLVTAEGCTVPLPMEVRLDSFRIRLSRRTHQPTDYVSYLHLDGRPVRVSMNRVAQCRHYRFCQTSYDEDGSSWLTVSHDPWGIGFTYAGYLCWAVAAWAWLFHPRASFRRLWRRLVGSRGRRWTLLLFSLLVLGVLYLYISRWYDGSRPMPPVLATPLLGVHVALVMAAYLLLAVTFLMGWVGCLCPRVRTASMQFSQLLLLPAFCCLGTGILVGAYWANQSWGRYWSWDPKETWALITFLVYAVPLHIRRLPWLNRPFCYHLYMILAFLTVLMTWLGVNYLLGGLHSYAVK